MFESSGIDPKDSEVNIDLGSIHYSIYSADNFDDMLAREGTGSRICTCRHHCVRNCLLKAPLILISFRNN